MPECSKRVILTVATGVFGFASFICLCVAVSTDYWLYALERYTEDHSGTNWTYKLTTTGLWRKCVEHERDPETKAKNCSYINYFKSQDKDGLGPTDAILLSLRRSTLFPLISLCILLAGQVIYVMSHCDRNRKVLTFVSGIVFVIAGLLILIGIILYIGAITEEAGNKSKSSMDKPRFEYWYGASFVFTITSFSTAEFTGVLSVYLYISRHKHSYRKKAERLHQNSFNQLQRHSRSVVSLSNESESKQRSADTVSNAYNTRSPLQVRSNGRANGCIGMNVFGANPMGTETTGNLLIGHQNLANDASAASLPSYDQSLFIDARRSEPLPPSSYHSAVESCWPYGTAGQHNKPSSAGSMVHSQWSGADLHPSSSTTDYNNYNDYNDYNDYIDDVAYGEPTSRASQGNKVPKDQSRYTLASGNFDGAQSSQPGVEWYTPNHGRVLSTPDSNVYRRTTPV